MIILFIYNFILFSQVLKSFKQLHRTRLRVFEGDERALTAARLRINEEYNKNRHVKDEEAIKAVSKDKEILQIKEKLNQNNKH